MTMPGSHDSVARDSGRRLRGGREPAAGRTVLLLAHSWPPDANVGAVRPVYLSRQLARNGWRPVVLTVREKHYESTKAGGILGEDSAHVLRTPSFRNPRFFYLQLKQALRWIFPRRRPKDPDSGESASLHGSRGTTAGMLKRNLLSLLYVPDEHLGWLPFALYAAFKAAREHQPFCVISTGPPHTSHLVALALRRLRGIPWIADFRDPWSWHDLPAGTSQLWAERINRRLERPVMRSADRVVCAAPGVTARYAATYPDQPPEKWVTITNGFDVEEFRSLGAVDRQARFTISYVGSFDFERSPRLLLDALSALIREGRIKRESVSARFIGPCDTVGSRPLREIAEELGLSDVVTVVPTVPRKLALAELLRSDALLLLAGSQRLSIAAKLYEYIASQRPILLVADSGGAAEIVNALNCGHVIGKGDLGGMKAAVAALYDARLAGDSQRNAFDGAELDSATLEYGWDRLGERYSDLVASISREARADSG